MDNEDLERSKKQLEVVMADINRQFGENSILRYGETNIKPWPHISTGALTLDVALGIGGLPFGRVVEIYGPESSGKSTICLSVAATAQKEGEIVAYIDAEHSLDPGYASSIGVNMDDLLLSQPDYGEQALDIMLKLVKSGVIKVVIIDSVAALVPKAELDGDMESANMGLVARMMSKSMRMLLAEANKTGTLVIFVNQIREKIGVFFGNPETTPGGRALKFASSVRIDLRKSKDLKDKQGELLGVKVKATIRKNKMAAPHKVAEFDINYGRGVDTLGCILDLCLERGVLTTRGAYIYHEEQPLGQGRANAIETLASDLEFAEKLRRLGLES